MNVKRFSPLAEFFTAVTALVIVTFAGSFRLDIPVHPVVFGFAATPTGVLIAANLLAMPFIAALLATCLSLTTELNTAIRALVHRLVFPVVLSNPFGATSQTAKVTVWRAERGLSSQECRSTLRAFQFNRLYTLGVRVFSLPRIVTKLAAKVIVLSLAIARIVTKNLAAILALKINFTAAPPRTKRALSLARLPLAHALSTATQCGCMQYAPLIALELRTAVSALNDWHIAIIREFYLFARILTPTPAEPRMFDAGSVYWKSLSAPGWVGPEGLRRPGEDGPSASVLRDYEVLKLGA